MQITAFEIADINRIDELEPVGWGDLKPRFRYFTSHHFCRPLKITDNGKIVAIGTTIAHTDSVWLATIITHPDYRNQGLGTTITKALIDSVDPKRYSTIYLDATEYGYPVYKKLGFEVEAEYNHYLAPATIDFTKFNKHIVPFDARYERAIYKLDQLVSAENRTTTLSEEITDSMLYVHENNVQGVFFPSLGDGLIIASHEEAGKELMKLRAQSFVKASLPAKNEAGNAFLKENGFEFKRISRRMRMGDKREHNLQLLYNRISGQLG